MRFAVLLVLLSAVAFSPGTQSANVCASCHRREADQPRTPMGHALESVASCSILRQHPKLVFDDGAYSYIIERHGESSTYTVTDGKEKVSAPIGWAFGLGAAGQTYVFEYQGVLYESRVSYYVAINGLDLTMGAANRKPKDILEAAGRQMTTKEARDCFNCHSTHAVRGDTLSLDSMVPGVACERCHGSAAAHLQAVKTGDAAHLAMNKLGRLSTEEMSDFCGACHRTWADIAASGPRGTVNVRFQPYRLTNSKCYDVADARIRCTACHDPHADVVRDTRFYDSKCRSCHQAGSGNPKIRLCRVASADCASCHMPRVSLPGAHFDFTDHNIRIARAGSPYPD